MQDTKSCQNRNLGTIPQLCRAISSQLRHVSTIGKNLLSSNTSSTCPHNMVNFGLLAAEIISLVWGIPGNFNGFCVLAALLHGTLVVGVSQTAAMNRGRHLYSAGRPSRWALAHISSLLLIYWKFSAMSLTEFWKSISTGQSERQKFRGTFPDTVYIQYLLELYAYCSEIWQTIVIRLECDNG